MVIEEITECRKLRDSIKKLKEKAIEETPEESSGDTDDSDASGGLEFGYPYIDEQFASNEIRFHHPNESKGIGIDPESFGSQFNEIDSVNFGDRLKESIHEEALTVSKETVQSKIEDSDVSTEDCKELVSELFESPLLSEHNPDMAELCIELTEEGWVDHTEELELAAECLDNDYRFVNDGETHVKRVEGGFCTKQKKGGFWTEERYIEHETVDELLGMNSVTLSLRS